MPSTNAAPFLLKPHANGTRTLLTHMHFCVELYPDDAKDKVFLAIVKALLRGGNRPCTPKELSNLILKHKLTTLGGATPYATVSSRISQHFRRAADLSRSPLLGRRSLDNKNSRRLVYFVDQVGVPVNPGEDRTASDSEDSGAESAEPVVNLASSPVASSTVSEESSVATAASDYNADGVFSPVVHEGPGHGVEPATPLRVSTRVKRRRSPYSPADEPQALSKRSRSSSFSNQTPLGTNATLNEKEASSSETSAETTLSSFHGRSPKDPTSAKGIEGILANDNIATRPNPVSDLNICRTELQDGNDNDVLSHSEACGQSSETTFASSSPTSPSTQFQGQSSAVQEQAVIFVHHTPAEPDFALRPRTSSDDFVLQPITSPHIPIATTLPSQLSPSQPALDFDVPREFLSSSFLDPESDPLGIDACNMVHVPTSHPYRGDSALSGLKESGLGVYHDFHHPENVSVSELDFLLGDGGDAGWGLASSAFPVVKRVVESQAEHAERDLKRRKVDIFPGHSAPEDQRESAEAIVVASVINPTATAPPKTIAEPVHDQQACPPNCATLSLDARSAPSSPSRPPVSRSTVVSSSDEAVSRDMLALSDPAPISVSSYRCNGDTLEIYEKVAHDPVAVRASKIKVAPRLDMSLRVFSLDSTGRLVSTQDDVRVGVNMEGYVRAKELFDFGNKYIPPVILADEVAIKLESGEEADDGDSTWAAYFELLEKRALGPRAGNESAATRITGYGKGSAEFLFVELKGSDVEGHNGVPAECGGVWIPTPEARRLAEILGIADRLDDLFSTGSSSVSDIKPLPSALILTSPTFPSLLSTPIRPSTLTLPSTAPTPVIKTGVKGTEPSLATAGLDEEVKHDDFLVFEGSAGWGIAEDGGAGESGDDSLTTSPSRAEPASLPPVFIDPTALHLVPPVQPVSGGAPMYMTNIDGILCYIMWLVKGSDGTFVGTPAKELTNPLEAPMGSSVVATKPPVSITAATSTLPAVTADISTAPPPLLTTSHAVPLLRRVDNNMVNATLLLHAGGLVTDKERSIVLSLERGRARCRKKGSGLYGTWIPLARARHLARTFCLQSRLGGFLSDGVSKVCFGLSEGAIAASMSSSSLAGKMVESNEALPSKAADTDATAAPTPISGVPKAAQLGLSSLPPSVPAGSTSDQTSVRGLLASARGRGRGRPQTPISGRSLIGGRVGSGLYNSNVTPSPPVIAPTPTAGAAGSSSSPLAGISNSTAMAATQAAIAALTKLGGSGPLTAATLASALAALNQVQPGAKGAAGSSTGAPTMPHSSSIPSPASILQAFASVFKNGFGSAWKPTRPTPTVGTTGAAGSSTGTSYVPNTITTTVSQQLKLDAKPGATGTPPFPSSATPSSAPRGLGGVAPSPSLPLGTSQSTAAPGVVARALAAAGAGRGAVGLNKPAISNPISIQTNALAGLPNMSFPLMPYSITAAAATGSSTSNVSSGNPTAATPTATTLPTPTHMPVSSSAPSAALPALSSASLSQPPIQGASSLPPSLPSASAVTLAAASPPPSTIHSISTLRNTLPLLPTMPIIAIDDIDGGDCAMPIASPEALAAAAAAAGVPLPVRYVDDDEVQIIGVKNAPQVDGPLLSATSSVTSGPALPFVPRDQLSAFMSGVSASGNLEGDDDDEFANVEAVQEDSMDEEDRQDADEDSEDFDSQPEHSDEDDESGFSDSADPLHSPDSGEMFVLPSGGKVRPAVPVAPTPPAKSRGKGRGKAPAKRNPPKKKAAGGAGGALAGAAGGTGAVKSRPTPKTKKSKAAASTAGMGRGWGRGEALAGVKGDESEGSDFEIDVCDGDGVDDFR